MRLVVDGDCVYFPKACSKQTNDYEMCQEIDKRMQELIDGTFSDSYVVYVKGRGNFRTDAYSDYKSNRGELEERLKRRLNVAWRHMQERWGAVKADGQEADDACSIECQRLRLKGEPYVLARVDKDLAMVPGTHYLVNKDQIVHISEDEADYNYHHQLLTGDRCDGIDGLPGVGPKTADKLLDGVEHRTQAVIDAYLERSPHSQPMVHLKKVALLIRMRTE